MVFRPATRDDLAIVMAWIPDADACNDWAGPRVRFPLEIDQLCEAIEFNETLTYSFDGDGGLLAVGQIRMYDDSRGHLSRIVVNPSERGRGVGRAFVWELISEAKKLQCQRITLHVVMGNAVAIGLYESMGFVAPSPQPDGLREGIYYMELS